jgi:hypothetical protein
MKRPEPRKATLRLEPLEPRELPTSPLMLASAAAAPNVAAILRAGTHAAADSTAQPTPHELRREQFRARFSGKFVSGAGRFTNQALQTYIQASGTSTSFLHGDLQMAVYTPTDPNAQTSGLAALIVKNVTNSGNLLVLDLVGDTSSLDRAGRPTRFTWTVDGASGGAFANATGSGTVEIRYFPGGKLPQRATSAGSVGVIFKGLIQTTGVTNLLRS